MSFAANAAGRWVYKGTTHVQTESRAEIQALAKKYPDLFRRHDVSKIARVNLFVYQSYYEGSNCPANDPRLNAYLYEFYFYDKKGDLTMGRLRTGGGTPNCRKAVADFE
jgi:hypothetical protein